jgi:two-component sensor histidine kinase
LGCVSFALVLIHRLVRALAVSEDLALRLEARVAERTLALQEADAAKTRFLAAASHDLRQPVAAIGLLVGLARDRVADAGQAGVLDRIQGAVRALEGLLRGLLDLSRLDSAAGAPLRQAVPLQALFDGLALHHQADAQARGLRLLLRPTTLQVDSDPILLDQVLRNLVGNALRHTRRGGVLVAARRHGAHGVRLQVWDTGIGIPADQQQRVFEPFVQLHDPLPGPSPGHRAPGGRPAGPSAGAAVGARPGQLLQHRPAAGRWRPGRTARPGGAPMTRPVLPPAGSPGCANENGALAVGAAHCRLVQPACRHDDHCPARPCLHRHPRRGARPVRRIPRCLPP